MARGKLERFKLSDLILKQLDFMDPAPLNPFEIKNYIYYGFSDDNLRPRYWRILLNHYSENKFKTEMYYSKSRRSYQEINDSIINIKVQFEDLILQDLNRMSALKEGEDCYNYKEPMFRILKAFTHTNPSLKYIQGMNYLLLPIFHVMITSKEMEISKFAEEDSFYMFNNLIAEIGDNFVEEYDAESHGIKEKINQVFNIIKEKDFSLYQVLEDKKLIETMFPIKWVMLLFSGNFNLESTIKLWDKILSDSYRFEIILYCCASAIILLRNILLNEQFDKCMLVLQNPKLLDVELIFDFADVMRRENVDIKEYLKRK